MEELPWRGASRSLPTGAPGATTAYSGEPCLSGFLLLVVVLGGGRRPGQPLQRQASRPFSTQVLPHHVASPSMARLQRRIGKHPCRRRRAGKLQQAADWGAAGSGKQGNGGKVRGGRWRWIGERGGGGGGEDVGRTRERRLGRQHKREKQRTRPLYEGWLQYASIPF